MLPSLAFEKKEKIGDFYDMIVQEIQNVCDRICLEPEKIEKVDELCLYFGSTDIKSLVHFGIQSYFIGAHPNMWKVVGSLQKDASMQTFLMHRVAISSQKRKSIEY